MPSPQSTPRGFVGPLPPGPESAGEGQLDFRQPQRPNERLKGLEALVRRCLNLAVLEIGYNADAENEALQRHLREVKRSAALARRRFRGVAGSVMGMRREPSDEPSIASSPLAGRGMRMRGWSLRTSRR